MPELEKDIGALLNNRGKWSDQGAKSLSLDPNIYVNDQTKVEISKIKLTLFPIFFMKLSFNCKHNFKKKNTTSCSWQI